MLDANSTGDLFDFSLGLQVAAEERERATTARYMDAQTAISALEVCTPSGPKYGVLVCFIVGVMSVR